jgi:hypothetical protein
MRNGLAIEAKDAPHWNLCQYLALTPSSFPAGPLANLSQSLKETSSIQIIIKDVFTPISPAHHMISGPLKLHPHFPSH